MMFFNPHFLNNIVTYWLVNIPDKEILEDFKKCLKYCVFSALNNVVGEKVYPYTDRDTYKNLYGWEINNFTSRDGLDLYSRLLYFGMERYKIEVGKELLLVRDCQDFIEAINTYQDIPIYYKNKLI